MSTTRPIKRHKNLKPVSRDHHHGLLLCWKLRTGLRKNVDPARMMAYCQRFHAEHLVPHFGLEEEAMFPILGNDHELVQRALAEHRRLNRLFTGTEDPVVRISQIEEELEAHIRFEERVLFTAIEEVATDKELARIHEMHGSQEPNANEDPTEDAFWL